MDSDSDVYGLIDTVINFRETMHRGAIPIHGRPPRGRLESLFATIF